MIVLYVLFLIPFRENILNKFRGIRNLIRDETWVGVRTPVGDFFLAWVCLKYDVRSYLFSVTILS